MDPASIQPTTRSAARYDSVAHWYDDTFRHGYTSGPHSGAAMLAALIGRRAGTCIDLGCGTGFTVESLATAGLRTIGVDVSSQALTIGRQHGLIPVVADAARTPFRDASVDTVVATYLHTDVDDMAPVVQEVARLLRPGGMFFYLGTHPCFIGHFVERHADGARTIHAGYREATWHTDSRWWGDGIRRRVGARHVPLAELINAFIVSGLRLVRVVEPHDGQLVPGAFAVVAEHTGAASRASSQTITGARHPQA